MFIFKMKILVTGCAGLIGSNFCRYLLQHNPDIEIIGVDDLSGGYLDNVPKEIQFIHGDLTNKVDQQKIETFFPVDYIFHFAAYAAEGLSPFIRQFNYSSNVIATAFLINCGIKYNVKRFVFTSSMAVYGDQQVPFDETMVPKPIDPYGIAKYACEMDLHCAYIQHGMEYCIIRPHNVYGPLQNVWDPYRNVLGIWMLQCLENKPMTIYGDGQQTRSFSYIDDILPCLWNAAVYDKARNQIVNLGSIDYISLNDANKIVAQITGYTNVIYKEPRHEVKHAWCTHQKSVDILDYNEKISLENGLSIMWKWLQKAPKRTRKFWEQYEINSDIYSYWK